MSRRVERVRVIVNPLIRNIFPSLALGCAITGALAGPTAAVDAPPPPQSQNPLLRKVAVFGRDERTALPQTRGQILSKIGVLHDPRTRSVCTAFCVAPDVVATAAHCLYRTGEEAPSRLSDITVRLNETNASSRVAGAAEDAPEPNVLAGSTRLNVKPPIDATHDWALVRLANPICRAGALKISRRPVEDVIRLARQGRVYNVAYHRDLPKWQPMLADRCKVERNFRDADWQTIRQDFADPEQLILHTCDTGGASSGSPLLVDGPGGPEVVGINVGTYVQSKVIMLNGEVVHRFRSDDVANTGVNSLAFATALDLFTSADMIASKREMRRLQAALAQRGLYQGANDGRYGVETKAAIESYERAAAMPVTGLATQGLLRSLLDVSEVSTSKISGNAPQR